jgi:hypothetical protein
MLRFVQIGFFLVLGILGCKNVQPSDLTGTWTIEDASRRALPAEFQGAPAQFVLNANGTFAASDIPGLFYFPGRHAARLESGSGTWKLASQEGEQRVQLNFQAIAGWKDALPYGTQLDVSRKSLFYFFGDADEGRRIAYDRK